MKRHSRLLTVRGACIVVAAATAAVVLAIADPATAAWMPPCLWRSATGWLCPGCGSARAVHALLHGDLNAALQFNPLAIATLPFATVDVVNRIRGRGPASTRQYIAVSDDFGRTWRTELSNVTTQKPDATVITHPFAMVDPRHPEMLLAATFERPLPGGCVIEHAP